MRNYAEVENISPGISRVKKPKNYLKDDADRDNAVGLMKKLCDQLEGIFKKEPRLVKVQSPVYIFGDIHGNLKDLLQYEGLKWKRGPHCEAANFLFLGDYVDRGDNSLEVSCVH